MIINQAELIQSNLVTGESTGLPYDELWMQPSLLRCLSGSQKRVVAVYLFIYFLFYFILFYFFFVAVQQLSRVTPWTIASQTPPSMGFSRQEYWSGLPFPSPGDLPNLGIKPASTALQVNSLPLSHMGSPSEAQGVRI